MFQILVCFLCKDCKLPCKRSPPLSQLTPLKIEVLSSPSLFENLVGVSAPPPPPPPHPAERGVVHYVYVGYKVIDCMNMYPFIVNIDEIHF